MTLKLSLAVAHNVVFLEPRLIWKGAPVLVFELMPAANGVWERYLDEFNYREIGQSFSHRLRLDGAGTGFECCGLRFRCTAMPEHTGRAEVNVMRQQDPQVPPSNRRRPALTVALERLPAAQLPLCVDVQVEVAP